MLDNLNAISFIVSLAANVQTIQTTYRDAAEAQARQPCIIRPFESCRLEGQLNKAAPLFFAIPKNQKQ